MTKLVSNWLALGWFLLKNLVCTHHPRPAHSSNPSVHSVPQRQYKTTSHPSLIHLPNERCLMATSPKWRLHNRKRRYTEAELAQDDLPSLPSKRFKRPPAFWDNLSKIPLTYSALEELEGRYALSNRSCVQPKVKKPRTRSAIRKFKQKAQPTVPVSEYLSKASQADIALLKVFAAQQRRGGPDLTNLRGVCITFRG